MPFAEAGPGLLAALTRSVLLAVDARSSPWERTSVTLHSGKPVALNAVACRRQEKRLARRERENRLALSRCESCLARRNQDTLRRGEARPACHRYEPLSPVREGQPRLVKFEV